MVKFLRVNGGLYRKRRAPRSRVALSPRVDYTPMLANRQPVHKGAGEGRPHRRRLAMRLHRSIVCLLLLTAIPEIANAARTDVVLLVNGNTITGEIKSMDFGSLNYKTDSMGTVAIDWEDIVGITTKQTLQVEVTDGSRYFGRLESAEERFHINVITHGHATELATSRIVRMVPIDIEETFWQRLEGSISFGFDTQKSTNQNTLRLSTDMAYRTRRYLVGLQANASITEQEAADTRERTTMGFNYQRFRPNRWFT